MLRRGGLENLHKVGVTGAEIVEGFTSALEEMPPIADVLSTGESGMMRFLLCKDSSDSD